MSTPIVKETRRDSQVRTIYQIETIRDMTWVPLPRNGIRHEGKFISHHPSFRPLTCHKSRVYEEDSIFAFYDDPAAQELAKALSKVWDMPLRVMKVQDIKIQKQEGKVILPAGGV